LTVCAWDGQSVCADSGGCFGNNKDLHPTNKILKRKGVVYAVAGSYAVSIEAVNYLAGGPKPHGKLDFNILQFKDGKCYLYADSFLCDEIKPPFAIGSGGDIALGAMLAGADAYQACKIARKVDKNSFGRIKRVRL